MLVGYINIASCDQNPDRQIERMRNLGIEERHIFIDKQSGKKFDCPDYRAMKQFLREGDLLYIDTLDCLGRNYDGILEEWKYITKEIHADIVILENEALFDSRKFKSLGQVGELMETQFLSLLSYVADHERTKAGKRKCEAIDIASKSNAKAGRNKIVITPLFICAYEKWQAGHITATAAMKQCGMKANTFYRRVQEYEETQ